MKNTGSFKQFGIQQAYEHIERLGDQLEPFSDLIDWKAFEKIFEQGSKKGRPPYDPVMMFKMLVIQNLYGISDEALEYQVADRVSFQRFLEFPKEIPDHSTIWRFRESISENNLHDPLWNELKKQMEHKGIKFSKGVIQDAAIITANPGKTNSGMNDRGHGQPTTRNEDASWTKKNGKSYFGYKLHQKMDRENDLITELAVTTASTHDSKIDLAKPDETVYRDKGYHGSKTRAKGDATMKRASRGNPITIMDQLRNKRIAKKRAKGERPFAVIKNVMHGTHTLLTELHRVFTQQLLRCITYNLIQLKRLT